MLLELLGRRILVDPMLDEVGARPPVESTPNPVRNPTVPRPLLPTDLTRDLDAVIVTHRHRDHLDGAAEALLPRDVPVFCQPEDAGALAALGLDARPVDSSLEWDGPTLRRTPARHGFGTIAEALAPVSGFVLDDVDLAETRCREGVAETIERYRPRIAVVNAGGARFLTGGPISMTPADVAEVAASGPAVVAVHMEAINHCPVTRAELAAAAVPGVLIPRGGETVEL